MRACGVCGTDVNFVRDWEGDPHPLGHEISAEVVETGGGSGALRPGDRVVVEDCTMCGVCADCKSGHPEFCRSMHDLAGQPGLGDYLLVRHNSLVPYEGLDHVTASLTEPLAVSLTSVLNARVPLGGSVVVFGPGPLGLMSARAARLVGARYVAMVGLPDDTPRERARLELAARFGCDDVWQTGRHDIEAEVKRKFPSGVDRVIVSSPPETLRAALPIVRFGGIVSFYGLHLGGRGRIEVDVNDLIFRKISLIPTFAEPAINFPVALRLLRDGQIDAGALVTHTFRRPETPAMLTRIVEGTDGVVKAVMVEPD